MNILMICQHYWPEHFQITEVCEELVRRGHEVTALVGIPNYPTGIIPDEYLNGQNREQVVNGVRIVRCSEVPRKPGVLGLAKNYFSYMLSAKAKVKALPKDFDLVFAYQISPVLMSAPASNAKKHTGAPVLLYCADIWPDAVKAMLPEKLNFMMPAIRAVSTKIYSAADFVATNSKAYVECFEQVHGFSRHCLRYIPQYAEDTYLDMDLDAAPSNKVRFMIMGNIGKLQHMPSVLEAVKLLKHRNDFELHIVGTGSVIEDCRSFVRDNNLEQHVIFHGRHPFEKMPDFYRMADACILTLNVPGAPWISSTLPSRLQGYMAAGKPILAAIDGSANEVIREAKCGKAVSAGDSSGLATLMADYIDNRKDYEECGSNGRAYFRAHFMKDRYMDEMERLMLQLVERA